MTTLHLGKEERPLYRGICKIEVRFIEVPLYLLIKLINFIANEDLNLGHHFYVQKRCTGQNRRQ